MSPFDFLHTTGKLRAARLHLSARLVIDSGRTIASVAAEPGIGAQLLGRWMRTEKARTQPASLNMDERQECQDLEGSARRMHGCGWTTSFWGKRRPLSALLSARFFEAAFRAVHTSAASRPSGASCYHPRMRSVQLLLNRRDEF